MTSSRKIAIDASYPWQLGGLTMQTISKTLVYVVFACLLLFGVSGPRRPLHRAHGDNHFGRERQRALARHRRCRQDGPAPYPERPCENALLPPDEDDDGERDRFNGNDSQQRLPSSCHDQANLVLFPTARSQPLPTDVPRYQVLCILLI
ncbi:MAG TPA: hypothetical protein VMG10_35280 [Gemmataceae bacterium]|nr:hypothetical protein [Gemmataceae bacterium]